MTWDTHHSSGCNTNTKSSWAHHERETTRQTGARRKTESDSEERMEQHVTDLLVWDFHTWPKTDWILLKQRNIWPREWVSLVNSTLSRWNVQRDIWWESPKQRWDIEDRNMLAKITVFVDSDFTGDPSLEGRARRDGPARSVATLWNLDRRLRAWQHWALEKRSFTQWCKDVKLDYPWDLCTKIWEFQWRSKCKVTVRRRFLWRIDWEQDSERNTLTRGTFWIQGRVQDGDLSIKNVLTVKNCTDVGMKPVSASVLQTILQVCRIGILLTMDPTEPMMDLVTVLETDSCQRWSWTSRREWKPVNGGRVWALLHDEEIMEAMASSKARARCKALARCSAKFCEHWLTPHLARTFRAHGCVMVTAGESRYRRYQDQPMCARTELFRQESVGRRVFFDFVDPSLNPVSLLNVSLPL